MAMEMYQGFSEDQLEMLHQHLDVNAIKHRPGGRGMLKYIKGDTAIDTANRIFGYGKWGYKVVSRSHEVIDDDKKGKIEFYTADVELSVVGSAFPFPGDGVGIVTAPYTVEMHEKARKEATTDALKRALRHYGDQFGLSLYDEDDYVNVGNGELMRVGDVKPGNKAQQPKRIVDAQNAPKQIVATATPQPAQVTKTPSIKFLRKKCDEIFGTGQWDAVLAILFNAILPDENITPEQANTIYGAMSSKAKDTQIASIRTLSQKLERDEPENIADMNYIVARRIIQGLTAEYKEQQQNKAS